MSYPTRWPEWLTYAASDGRGGLAVEAPSVVRGFARSFIYNFGTHPVYTDWQDGVFTADLKASPDSATSLATLTVSTGTASGGVTPVTFTLAGGSAQDNIPIDDDDDGLVEVLMQVNFTPTDGAEDAIIQTRVIIVGDV